MCLPNQHLKQENIDRQHTYLDCYEQDRVSSVHKFSHVFPLFLKKVFPIYSLQLRFFTLFTHWKMKQWPCPLITIKMKAFDILKTQWHWLHQSGSALRNALKSISDIFSSHSILHTCFQKEKEEALCLEEEGENSPGRKSKKGWTGTGSTSTFVHCSANRSCSRALAAAAAQCYSRAGMLDDEETVSHTLPWKQGMKTTIRCLLIKKKKAQVERQVKSQVTK